MIEYYNIINLLGPLKCSTGLSMKFDYLNTQDLLTTQKIEGCTKFSGIPKNFDNKNYSTIAVSNNTNAIIAHIKLSSKLKKYLFLQKT